MDADVVTLGAVVSRGFSGTGRGRQSGRDGLLPGEGPLSRGGHGFAAGGGAGRCRGRDARTLSASPTRARGGREPGCDPVLCLPLCQSGALPAGGSAQVARCFLPAGLGRRWPKRRDSLLRTVALGFFL